MKKIFDAHMHLNTKAEDIISDIMYQVETNRLDGINLILNNEEEKKVFIENRIKFFALPINFVVSVSLDLHTESNNVLCEILRDKNIKTAIKLHPRIQNITINDFELIKTKLKNIQTDVIIIDTFFSGHLIQNHIGIELTIYLAQEFPEKKIIVAHMGGHRALDCVMLTKTLENVYHDISFSINFFEQASIAQDILFLCKKYNKRIMFGSDYPYYTTQEALSCLERYFNKADFDEIEKNNILYYNANSVFIGD